MNQRKTDEHVKVISSFDAKIAELHQRVANLEDAKKSFRLAVVNHTIDQRDEDRGECHSCCGAPPRQLILSDKDCPVSPIGTCVHQPDSDSSTDCIFCFTNIHKK
jgi:hypothetical protein